MAEMINLQDFIKPSIEKIRNEKNANDIKNLSELLKIDGAPIAKAIIDFLATAFVDISDGAHCCEYENKFENLEIYVNIKKRGAK